jgi:signal transduction histidine kinase
MTLNWELLANVSHEIRSPLNGMVGCLRLVLDGVVDDQAEEQEFLLEAHRIALYILNIGNALPNPEVNETNELQTGTEAEKTVAKLSNELRSNSSILVHNLALVLNANADNWVEQRGVLQETHDLTIHLLHINDDLLNVARNRGATLPDRPYTGHFSTVRTRITDVQILKLSLEQLGYPVEMEADMRGSGGQKVRVDIVAILEGDCDIGWSRNTDGSFDLIADVWGVSMRHNFNNLINSINYQYVLNAL